MQFRGAGNWNDPRLLRQQPRKGDLSGRCVLPFRDSTEQIDQSLICFSSFRRESRDDVAEVGAFKFGALVDFPGEEAFAQRAERNEADPEFLQSWNHLRFRLAPPQRVFALERGHRLDGVRAADRLHSSLGKAKVLYLACPNQILYRSGHIFDRHVRVDTVLIY